MILQPIYIESRISSLLPETAISEDTTRSLVMSDVRRVAEGLDVAVDQGAMTADEARNIRTEFVDVRERLGSVGVALGSEVDAPILNAAQQYRELSSTMNIVMTVLVLALGAAGLTFSYVRTDKDFRARNVVESVIKGLLILASTIAILTTVGIVFSMLFETRNFFTQYNWVEFFFGTVWDPSFSGRGGLSEFGLIPLLWGTLYISFIALSVAVPIGLFAAIYMSE